MDCYVYALVASIRPRSLQDRHTTATERFGKRFLETSSQHNPSPYRGVDEMPLGAKEVRIRDMDLETFLSYEKKRDSLAALSAKARHQNARRRDNNNDLFVKRGYK